MQLVKIAYGFYLKETYYEKQKTKDFQRYQFFIFER